MAGKRQNKADKWLPPRVYRGRSRYEYVPKSGEKIKLCFLPKDGEETPAVQAEVWAEYSKAIAEPVSVNDVSRLIDAFHQSLQFSNLAATTQGDYIGYSKRIKRVFGAMEPQAVKPPHIRAFMDSLAKKGTPVAANRSHSYLSILFNWGVSYGWLESNPAKGVRKFKEVSRSRYIEDWELELVERVARESAYPYVAPMMEIAYLCRARTIEIRRLTEAEIREDGIFLDRAKGSQGEITAWSDRLIEAVEEARTIYPGSPVSINRPLFHTRTGCPLPAESFKTAWQRVMKKALQSGLKEKFTFHDIKAKGCTDHTEENAGHHSTKKAAAIYKRKPNLFPSTK